MEDNVTFLGLAEKTDCKGLLGFVSGLDPDEVIIIIKCGEEVSMVNRTRNRDTLSTIEVIGQLEIAKHIVFDVMGQAYPDK